MQFAEVNGARTLPGPKLKGQCPVCGAGALAKCGDKVIWHWAHAGRRHCDPWWENETPWHRDWKSCFPEEWREVVHHDANTGEKHVADVKTPEGTVIEFQNSPMPLAELQAREAFYGQMVWIVNGLPLRHQFDIAGVQAPNPEAELTRQMLVHYRPPTRTGPMRMSGTWSFQWRADFQSSALAEVHSPKDVEAEYLGHEFFHWKRPRTVWYDAKAPVYFDFGDSRLWRVLPFDPPRLHCVVRHEKVAWAADHGGTLVWVEPEPPTPEVRPSPKPSEQIEIDDSLIPF